MRKPDVLEKKPMNMAEVRKELKAVEKRDEELSFRGNRTMEYLDEFSKLSAKKAEELKKEFDDLDITRLKDEFVNKIIDIMPRSQEELKVVLQGFTLSISKENMKKIMDVLDKYN